MLLYCTFNYNIGFSGIEHHQYYDKTGINPGTLEG
jgi:hypothetical protein